MNSEEHIFEKAIFDKNLKEMNRVSHANIGEIMGFEALSFD